MKLTIHRGTHEIGGSCLELSSNSGRTRVIIDIGLPLVNADGSNKSGAAFGVCFTSCAGLGNGGSGIAVSRL